jgi:hypothetical protein
LGGLSGGLTFGLSGAPPELELVLKSLEGADIVVSAQVVAFSDIWRVPTEATEAENEEIVFRTEVRFIDYGPVTHGASYLP